MQLASPSAWGATIAECELNVRIPQFHMESEQRFLDSKVAALTNFKPRSQSSGSQENLNERGFLTWRELRAFAITEERLGCLWPENTPNMGNVTLDK